MQDRIYKPREFIAHYEVLEHLATGGFSSLYKARDYKDSPRAAASVVKISRYDYQTLSKQARFALNARLRREYQVLAEMDHPNVARVFETGFHEGAAWFAVELLRGPTLESWMAEQRRAFGESLNVFRQVVEALADCHLNGIIHRDLKPSNIIVTTERPGRNEEDEEDEESEEVEETAPVSMEVPVLFDFGIAQDLTLVPVTATGEFAGTWEYVTPDYARALLSGAVRRAAHRAEPHEDVYQAGVLLYMLLTGRRPTTTPRSHFMDLLAEIRDQVPPHPRDVFPEAPPALSSLAMMCLEKQGSRRPADGSQLLWALMAALQEDAEHLDALGPDHTAALEGSLLDAPSTIVPVVSDSDASPPTQVEPPPRFFSISETASPAPPSPASSPPPAPLARSEPTADAPRESPQRVDPTSAPLQSLLRYLQFTQVALGAFIILLFTILAVSAIRLSTAWVQATATHERVLQLAQEILARGPSTPAPLASNVTAGLKMPEAPFSWQLRPDPDGKCRDSRTKRELQGYTVMRGGCWLISENGSYHTNPPQPRPCPATAYDPPPEVSAHQRSWCLRPVEVEKPGRTMTP